MSNFRAWGIAILAMPFFLWGCKSSSKTPFIDVNYGNDPVVNFQVYTDTITVNHEMNHPKGDFSISVVSEPENWTVYPITYNYEVLLHYMQVSESLKCLWLKGDGVVSNVRDSLSYAILDQKLYCIGLDNKILYEIPEFARSKKRFGRKLYIVDELGYVLQPSIYRIGNILYFPVKAYGIRFDASKNQLGIGFFNLDDFSFNVLNIPFPSFFDISHVGFLNNFYLSPYKEDKLLVTYALKPVGIIYNPKTRTVEDTISYKSVYDTLELQPFDRNTSAMEKMWKTLLYDGSYRGFVYNPAKKHYYCIYQIGQPENRPDGLKNTREDRRSAFVILNENLEVIYDRILPESIRNGSRIIPHEKGALFLAQLSEEERLKRPKCALEVNISYE